MNKKNSALDYSPGDYNAKKNPEPNKVPGIFDYVFP